MATSDDLLIKQRSVVEILAAGGCCAANIYARIKIVYGEICILEPMEYRHKTSPSPRKFKVVAFARKVLFTVFCYMKGVVHMEFLEQSQTLNSEQYISTL
ncbi:histone-lysine N-methyltransferase SETMAR [Elysia marginata]|uniref:Histone-lysine N-methyltransferase SETMAR n=1 Tax=Elysia marginata TaxID=1093978 RepID=A0AAV4GIU0_9GAST|nr:histone-lysine N-methyltransferase SETMAR [Elysia marginata]